MTEPDLQRHLLGDRYALQALLGEGGMAVIYQAMDTHTGQPVAVKFLRSTLIRDQEALARFQQEAQTLMRLRHPNIVALYAFGQLDGQPYLVMELIEGQSLDQVLQTQGRLPVDKAVDIAIQLCAALGAAHRAGLVHCDVKPQNILLQRNGHVKVTDFGIARAFSASALTKNGVVLGTPAYLAPEQAVGGRVSPATDVYAVGVVLYEMLAGRPPFVGDDPQFVARQQVEDAPPPIAAFNSRVPTQLAQIIHKTLSKEPSARYRNAEQLGRVLLGYRQHALACTTGLAPISAPVMVAPQHEARVVKALRVEVAPPLIPEPEKATEREVDGVALVLALIALVSVLGLIPLWSAVYRRYAAAPASLAPLALTSQPAVVKPVPVTPSPVAEITPVLPLQVRVPDLVGRSQSEARQQAEAMGLKLIIVSDELHPDVPALHIIRQTPAPGSLVPAGSPLEVVISRGPGFIVVPRSVGQPIENVSARLLGLGLQVEQRSVWSREPPGTVLAQDPPPESLVLHGARVVLVVSQGPEIRLEATLDHVRLLSCELERQIVSAGESLGLVLRWQPLAPVDRGYTVFVHLTRPDGQVVAQQDGLPAGGTRPTDTWTVGEIVVDKHELRVDSRVPAGDYQLRVGLYAADTGQRVPVSDPGQVRSEQDSLIVTWIRVQ